MQRYFLAHPVPLELVSPASRAGASEVHSLTALLHGSLLQGPVHEDGRILLARFAQRRRPGEFQGLPMTDCEARSNGLFSVPDCDDFYLVGKMAAEILEPAFRINRRPKVAHVAGEDAVESVDHLASSP